MRCMWRAQAHYVWAHWKRIWPKWLFSVEWMKKLYLKMLGENFRKSRTMESHSVSLLPSPIVNTESEYKIIDFMLNFLHSSISFVSFYVQSDSFYNSVLTDIDISACDSGLDTPPSTHRPSSYRDVYMSPGARDSTDTGVSSSRGTLVSPGGSFRAANGNINGLR